jgi:hypothetical protein
MEIQHKSDTTLDGYVWRVGAWGFVGVFCITLFAILFLRVTVYSTVHWYIHGLASPERLVRALVAAVATGAVLSAILMAGTVLVRRMRMRRAYGRLGRCCSGIVG